MKNVGLVTYYGDNYGGMLQAYALQTVVKKQGFECQIISNDFLQRKTKASLALNKAKSLFKALKHPKEYMSKRKLYRQYSGERLIRTGNFKAFREKHLDVFNTGYQTYEQHGGIADKYDIFLCGSDQIWNPNLYSKNGFYFAEFGSPKALKISYASSIGLSRLDKKQAEFMAPMLNQLDIVSTREQKGAEIIEKISDKKARVVLDPTLLLTAEDWSKLCGPSELDYPYVLCYLFGERDYVEGIKKTVKELTGLKIVSIPFVTRELESDDVKIFDAGPSDFIDLIKNAALVLTDSFHATAFSINLKTRFISLCRFSKTDKKSMNDRLTTILDLVDLKDRLLDDGDAITKDFLFDVDFEKAHKLLNKKRQKDLGFLVDALNFEKKQ